jgi:RNA:NAD 2'-phosphotransferase (TPT1/KptA family)
MSKWKISYVPDPLAWLERSIDKRNLYFQLKLPKLRSVGFTELEKIVRDDNKGRYTLRFEPIPPNFREGEAIDGSVWWIRANQGHSMEVCLPH